MSENTEEPQWKTRLKAFNHWFWHRFAPWVTHTLEKPWLTRHDETVPTRAEQLALKQPITYFESALRRPKAPSQKALALGRGWDIFQQRRLPDGTRCHEYLAHEAAGMGGLMKKELYGPRTRSEYEDDKLFDNLLEADLPAAYIQHNGGGGIIFLFTLIMVLSRYAIYGMFFFVLTVTFLISFPVTIYVAGLVETLKHFHIFVLFSISVISIPLLLYCIMKIIYESRILHRLFFNPKIGGALRRDKGVFVRYKKQKPVEEIPFDELETTLSTNPIHGQIHTVMSLRHTKTNRIVWYSLSGQPADPGAQVKHAINWEIWQHFMDVSRPLPDIPKFEPYRQLDPTTIEWDKKHGRPPKLWENMDDETLLKLIDESNNAAYKYPFTDESRVKDMGWKPAGDGKHWYQLG
ncbi:MAG: hypothetical protein LAT65_21000 [Saccharospirillum sp.]|nr:hypothetical protein [Saccharospirillum sp.]